MCLSESKICTDPERLRKNFEKCQKKIFKNNMFQWAIWVIWVRFLKNFWKIHQIFFHLGCLGSLFPLSKKHLASTRHYHWWKNPKKNFCQKWGFFEAHTHFEGFYVKIFQKFFGKFFDLAQIVLTKIGFGDLLFAHPETIRSKHYLNNLLVFSKI